jgi:hypothetical protein
LLSGALSVLALLTAFQVFSPVASADAPQVEAGMVIIHKHCIPEEGFDGTFSVRLDFEFNQDNIEETEEINEDTVFDEDLLISCGDDDSETDDGDTIRLQVGVDLSELAAWLGEVGNQVTSATVTIREQGLPSVVSATYEGCDFDEEDLATITLGWVCTITNTLDETDGGEPGDDNGCPTACGCCGSNVNIDNTNTNVIGIENENENENTNNNTNDNENTNENTNTQNQTNDQDQDNDNTQTNNIDSSPEVNISGVAGEKPAPKPQEGAAPIKPPSTGDAGLAGEGRDSGALAAVAMSLVLALAGGVALARSTRS